MAVTLLSESGHRPTLHWYATLVRAELNGRGILVESGAYTDASLTARKSSERDVANRDVGPSVTSTESQPEREEHS